MGPLTQGQEVPQRAAALRSWRASEGDVPPQAARAAQQDRSAEGSGTPNDEGSDGVLGVNHFLCYGKKNSTFWIWNPKHGVWGWGIKRETEIIFGKEGKRTGLPQTKHVQSTHGLQRASAGGRVHSRSGRWNLEKCVARRFLRLLFHFEGGLLCETKRVWEKLGHPSETDLTTTGLVWSGLVCVGLYKETLQKQNEKKNPELKRKFCRWWNPFFLP